MNFKPIKTPKIAKKIFPNYIWDIPTKEKVIYLTFDDGPTPEITTWTLDVLKQYNAKATFFCIGNNIEKHPDIFGKTVNAGHAIGNHTFHHLKGWTTSSQNYLNDIEQTKQKMVAPETISTTKRSQSITPSSRHIFEPKSICKNAICQLRET